MSTPFREMVPTSVSAVREGSGEIWNDAERSEKIKNLIRLLWYWLVRFLIKWLSGEEVMQGVFNKTLTAERHAPIEECLIGCTPAEFGNKGFDEHAQPFTFGKREVIQKSKYLPVIDTSMTINPWAVEYKPNPVIFAHLAHPWALEHTPDPVVLAHLTNEASTSDDTEALPLLNPYSDEHPIVGPGLIRGTYRESKYRASNSKISSQRKRGLDADELSTDGQSMHRSRILRLLGPDTASDISVPHEKNGPRYLIKGHNIEDVKPSIISQEPAESLPLINDTWECPADSPLRPSSTQSSSILSDSALPFFCKKCIASFRTRGQRREHENRKHIRRFVCNVCTLGFNLRADLKRHEKSVHKSGYTERDQCGYWLKCPNVGCKSADKVWDRKDNYTRHVERCRSAIEKSCAGIHT
ncbi:hypothetical protein GQ44DRAFT_768118 [Phaeosphaeriaceae sp. PMI808]|nr:hypothetical protein GQ44DRAFT_768118 [Phaeosphaeriaceae sp. PMI808]